MKKPAKSSHRNKRNRRQPTHSSPRSGHPAQENGRNPGSSGARPAAAAAAAATTLHDDYEGKRRLWERKQAELEARWVAAQDRQSKEELARRRAARAWWRGAGIAAIAILLCVLALFYSQGGLQVLGMPGTGRP